MAKKKTKAKVGVEVAPARRDRAEYHSVSIRKIQNGFIVSKTTDRNGDYTNEEYFSKTRPKIDLGPKTDTVKSAAKSMEKFVGDEAE